MYRYHIIILYYLIYLFSVMAVPRGNEHQTNISCSEPMEHKPPPQKKPH